MAFVTDTVLQLHHITKRFGTLLANDDISLQLQRGEVLALLGENGAGKSTLMSVLFGHYTPDAGSIEVFGKPLPAGNPKAALAAGIGMVHQHFTLADNLTVLDNVMIGSQPIWQPITRTTLARIKLLQVAQQFGLKVEPDTLVRSLSVGERQRVELLKALYRGARILILDEPTAVLTPGEAQALFEVLGAMVSQGLSIIFISHKLGEVLRVSKRIAVLRAGKLVTTVQASQTTQIELAQWMVGHAVNPPQRHPSRAKGAAVCRLQDACMQPQTPGGRDRLDRVNLTLHSGEIVAVAGVSGNGQVALAQLLCGMRTLTSGSVQLGNERLQSSPAWLVARGVARIPEDRHSVGVVGDLPVWENAVSERLHSPAFSRWQLIRQQAAKAQAQAVIARFDVRGAGPDTPARNLSGGNIQKLILGRALLPVEGATQTTPLLIVAHQPTWGLDIGAVAFVQAQLIAARDAGAVVLLISDDLDEVMTLGDRIAVMHAGQVTTALSAEDWSREAIGLAMAGGTAPEALNLRAQFPDGPPREKLARSGGSAVHEVTSVGATST